MSRSFRRTCALLAPAAVLLSLCIPAAASAAPGDLPDLVQSRPGNVVGGYFDDHSISGDNHLGWSYGTSQSEPLAIDFSSAIYNQGAGALELCGFQSGTAGWMRAFQVAPGVLGNDCPPSAPASGGVGWFRIHRREPLVDQRVQPLALHGPAALRARPAAAVARRPVGCRDRMGHLLGHVPEPG